MEKFCFWKFGVITVIILTLAVVALSGVYDEEIENIEHSVFNRVFDK